MEVQLVTVCFILCLSLIIDAANVKVDNVTMYEPAARQLLEFKLEHPQPMLWTKSSGEPTEIREIHSINSDQFNNQLLLDSMLHFNGERIPERVVHAKGTGAFGYFEVTNDVSNYTYADVFNGIGKRTPLVARLSTSTQSFGGPDVSREFKGLSVKMYTKEGNFDLLCLATPVFMFRDPMLLPSVAHALKRNPKTHLFDLTSFWDIIVLKPSSTHAIFWIHADYGIPDGYRKMDAFAINTFEIANKKGDTHYVRFNFRTEQGIAHLTTAQAAAIQARDPDYYTRDLYNNIEEKNFPSWRLEMDVMTKKGVQNVDFDPFDVTRLWKNGTFITVQIGRLVLNRNVENQFRDVEQAAYNPANLIPGIPGPVDSMFRGRRNFYIDTQNYRLGRNHKNIFINRPWYAKNYKRDSVPPTGLNGGDGTSYYPNSFNGPVPFVDEKIPRARLITLESTAMDLEPSWYFYNFVIDNEAHRQRFINNLVMTLTPVTPPVIQKAMKLLYMIDQELGNRVTIGLEIARAQAAAEQAAARAANLIPRPVTNVVTVQAVDTHIKPKTLRKAHVF